MCCHTMYLGKKCFFFTLLQKHCTLGKTPLLPLGHAHLLEVGGFIRVLGFPPSITLDYHNITEILFKVALNTITLTQSFEFERTSDYSRNTSYARNLISTYF